MLISTGASEFAIFVLVNNTGLAVEFSLYLVHLIFDP